MTKPVVTVFTAPWCNPCKVFKPTLNAVHQENKEVFDLNIVDIDDNPDLMTKHGVRGVPTIMIRKNGEYITRTGGMSKGALSAFLSEQGINVR